MLTDDVLAKLTGHTDSTEPDEVIAPVEDLPVEAVTAWRASLSAPTAPEREPTPDPAPAAEPEAPTKAKAKEPKPDKPKPAKAPEPAPEPTSPASVIVTSRAIQLGQHLGPFARSPRRHDIYHGAQAAILWKHHRLSVEPWPKA